MSLLLLGGRINKFLAVLAVLHQDDLKNRMNCTVPGSFEKKDEKYEE